MLRTFDLDALKSCTHADDVVGMTASSEATTVRRFGASDTTADSTTTKGTAMTQSSTATEQRDRAQVEEVFGLTGGELNDEPWIVNDRATQTAWTFHYHYDFAPSYAERDFEQYDEVRTVVRCNMFGEPPAVLIDQHDASRRWVKVATFTNSGETECFGANNDAPNIVTAEQTATAGSECYYCAEPIGKPHTVVYIGDGWAEIVYRLQLCNRSAPIVGEPYEIGAETIVPTYVRESESPTSNGGCTTADLSDPTTFLPAGWYVEFHYQWAADQCYRRYISFTDEDADQRSTFTADLEENEDDQ